MGLQLLHPFVNQIFSTIWVLLMSLHYVLSSLNYGSPGKRSMKPGLTLCDYVLPCKVSVKTAVLIPVLHLITKDIHVYLRFKAASPNVPFIRFGSWNLCRNVKFPIALGAQRVFKAKDLSFFMKLLLYQ